jgi:hypothetical protein
VEVPEEERVRHLGMENASRKGARHGGATRSDSTDERYTTTTEGLEKEEVVYLSVNLL